MRFLVDMALSPGLADWLVQRGHDAVHASSIGLARAPDPDIIERARDKRRVIIHCGSRLPAVASLGALGATRSHPLSRRKLQRQRSHRAPRPRAGPDAGGRPAYFTDHHRALAHPQASSSNQGPLSAPRFSRRSRPPLGAGGYGVRVLAIRENATRVSHDLQVESEALPLCTRAAEAELEEHLHGPREDS